MSKWFKEFLLIIVGIVLFSLYDFLYNEGTVEFYVILKRTFIFGLIGTLLLLIIEMIKYFKSKKGTKKWILIYWFSEDIKLIII